MYLEIAPAGGKWWRLKYRFAKKEKLLSLGTYPEVTLAEARIKRDEARKLLREGIDPSAHRKALRASRAEWAAEEWMRCWHRRFGTGRTLLSPNLGIDSAM
jgi:hypothetical protein